MAFIASVGFIVLPAAEGLGGDRCCPRAASTERDASSLWEAFSNPPMAARPWCYWWWINGHADKETITADLEAMKRLGFGGVLMFDSRGYWDDEDHLKNPKAEVVWGSLEWYDRAEFAVRECARLGLVFTMNASASGGTLNGFIDGKEYETDIMNRDEVVAHFDRALGPLLKRVPDLVGKTFTHIYSVSYEGNVRTGGSWKTIKDTFYATMRQWAHAHGLQVYSESGGPWGWGAGGTKLDCDQLDMLAHNDFPQGEFWPIYENRTHRQAGRANLNGRFFSRAAVLSARREGRPIASLESFTHMHRHWTADPAFLKPLADIAFADGVNRLVWHTFTCSPAKFGVPGAEYFAGSHVNRNVTWHKDAGAFVKYIWRCQALLQRGEPVDDGEFVNVTTNYHGWGRFRKDANAKFTTTHRREGKVDYFFVAGEGKGKVVLNTELNGRTVEIWDAVTGRREELFTNDNYHNCSQIANGKTRVALDLPKGGSCFVVFAPTGRTGVPPVQKDTNGQDARCPSVTVIGPWRVSFAYHPGVRAAPPAPVTMDALRDWTTYGEAGKAESTSLRYFSGTASYRTTIHLPQTLKPSNSQTLKLSLGELPTGLAHVFVNGTDCGVVWCAPWEADISSAVRDGANDIEIRYTNNWANRLVGDCFLEPADRVTVSNMRYSREPRTGIGWKQKPQRYSGFAMSDALQPSGLLGPVSIKLPIASGEITIRSDYPGGNVKVCGIDEANGVVHIAPDLRDTQGRWFHWDFILRGAAGRKIHFTLPDDKWQYISSLGPAISKDGGRSWSWLRPDGTRHEPANAFDYTFGQDESETRFAVSIPYSQKDWDAFMAKWRGKGVVCGVLCKSQSGTRDTELVRIPCRKAAKWLFAFTARHHACETSANAPMEGVVEAILSGTPEGEWLRDNADCVFVPFMDKDGVENGDQGKNRRPYDHNRDYLKGLYTSVRALKELLVKESEGKRIVFIDMHSPHVRSLPSCPEQDQVFTFGCRDERLNAHWNAFRRNWKETQKGGALVYDGKYDIEGGKGYALVIEKQWANGFMSSDPWVRTLPNCYLATCCEFGYSLCGGVYSFPAARELGRNMLKALVRTAQSAEKP